MTKRFTAFFALLLLATALFAQYPASIQVYSGNDIGGQNCNPFPMANPNPPIRYNQTTGNYFGCSTNSGGATSTNPLWTAITVSTGTTGSGNMVMSTSPTLVTPALGTPASGVMTNLTGTPSGAGVMLDTGTISMTLTNLQSLNSVPFQVIAAPCATCMIQVGSCTLNLTRGSAAFTGGGTVSIGYDTTSTPATNGTIASTVFTTFAASHGVVVLPVAVAVTATTSLAAKGIYMTAASADFASGTGATGQLDCQYRILTGVS